MSKFAPTRESHTNTKKVAPIKLRLATAVEDLINQQRQRRFAIVSQSRCDRSIDSFVARCLGHEAADNYNDEKTADRKAKFLEAGRVRKLVEKGGDMAKVPEKARPCIFMIQASAQSRETWDVIRKGAEGRMRELAKMLPVYEFAESVAGFGDLALGVIIAESGNLNDYSSVAKLWKRLGLAVISGERQQKKTDKDLALQHGYNPKRRAEVWAFCSDSMFRHQWAGADSTGRKALLAIPKAVKYCENNNIDISKLKGDDLKVVADKFEVEIQGRAAGPYGEVYAKRRAATADRGWTPAHSHADGRRIMTKAIIRDLWRVWRGMPPRYAKPAEETELAEAAD